MSKSLTIADLTHPVYEQSLKDWALWRDVYQGGTDFINKYLRQFSTREDAGDYAKRKEISYNPAFAKSAVNEIKNAIFQRLVDISRHGGSEAYQRAIRGQDRGVDLLGSTMNAFLGRKALPELLTMARVGVFVDMPQLSGITVADNLGKRPYLYIYKAEDIRTWRFDEYSSQNEFSNLLLRDYILQYDEDYGLPIGESVRFRHMWVEGEKVHCEFFGEDGTSEVAEPVVLDIDRIPFVVLELSDSLLSEVSRYQVALLNMASSDLNYILQSNFPFYTEQFEPRATSEHVRPVGSGDQVATAEQAGTGKSQEVKVGVSRGRRYPKGLERPGFIAPPAEPLKASMEKQEQMKAEIRQLVHLSVANLQPRDASAESKGMDNQGLESGLSYIGLELEYAERKIADYWAMYERSVPATVSYPEKYSLRSEADRRDEAKELTELLARLPSETARKEVCKRIIEVMLGNKVSNEQLDKIRREIDTAHGLTTEVDILAKHVEIGILDLELAAKLCGYPEGTVEKAKKDHTDRLSRIAEHQAEKGGAPNPGARGVGDQADNPAAGGKPEKAASRDTTQDDKVTDKVRGEGK